MKLTVVTCTGARPEAFMLCQYWISRQTLQPNQWIVLDDEEPQTECIAGQEHIHCPQFRGRMSLLNKISWLASSGKVKGDGLVFVEDDDWYSPNWLQFCSDKLSKYCLVGEGRAIYYNVRYRFWFDNGNTTHSSLCSTAIRTSELGALGAQCNTASNSDPFLDARIWPNLSCSKQVFHPSDGRLVIGIKGMPGRGGYNVGHEQNAQGAIHDPDLVKLKSLIGNDAEIYRPFYVQ